MAQFFGANKIDVFKQFQKNMIGINLIFAAIFTIIANVMPEKLISIYSNDPEIQRAGAKFLK